MDESKACKSEIGEYGHVVNEKRHACSCKMKG